MKTFLLGEISFDQLLIYLLRQLIFKLSKNSKLLAKVVLNEQSYLIINAVNKISKIGAIRKKGQWLEVKIKGEIIKARKRSSDLLVIKQIFEEEEYKNPIKDILKYVMLSDKPVILDCGANIGASTLYFKSKFPMAKIYPLEPFKSNFYMLKQNYQSDNCIWGGLWSKNTNLKFDMTFRDGKEWSIKTVETNENGISAFSLSEIMNISKNELIDILKLDIEGSEFEVLLKSKINQDQLKKIKTVIIEIHDEAGDRSQINYLFRNKNFKRIEYGELTMFLNKEYLIELMNK